MVKNIIIAGLIASNLIVIGVLVFVLFNWQPPSRFNSFAKHPKPTQDLHEEVVAQEFIFKAGDHLNFKDAPAITERALTITATFDTQNTDGVIVAQGGTAQGYTLYVQDGELFFALRRNNALTIISAGKISATRHSVAATLSSAGDLAINVDGQPKATGKAEGTLTLRPADGLDVGSDRGAPVGPYSPPNSFGGIIESVKLSTAPRRVFKLKAEG